MNSYTLAFTILGGGLLLAGILWSVPRLKHRASVRRFRQDLANIDVVALGWAQSLRQPFGREDVPAPMPELRRGRRARRNHPPAEGDPLV